MEDTLIISIKPRKEGETTIFQATLQQRGAAFLYESFRKPEEIYIDKVQALRTQYEQEIRRFHTLTAAGMAIDSQAQDLHSLRELGRQIANVLPSEVRLGISLAVQRAQQRRRTLRLMLEVAPEAAALLALPWELMMLPSAPDMAAQENDDFLLLDGKVTLIRQERGRGRNTPPQLTPPLKLQAFAASPNDFQPIDIQPTYNALAQVLSAEELCDCWHAGVDTLNVMQQRIGETKPQIVHLLCHGAQNDTGRGKRSDMLLTHADGSVQRVSVPNLAPILTLAPDLQLVILQACHSGTATHRTNVPTGEAEQERRATENIALELVRRGVPMVVAMQSTVGQVAASAFIEHCYRAIQRGDSIERAVACGRVAMRTAGSPIDWSMPVIYQGSGLPDYAAWHTRIADWLDSTLFETTLSRGLRGVFVVLGLLLFTLGVMRWVLLPPAAVPQIAWWSWPLWAWLLAGIAVPAMIAAAQREYRERDDLEPAVRRAVRRAQWAGAYLGYIGGGVIGMVLLALAWVVGLVTRIGIFIPLFAAVLVGAMLVSYTISRSQARSALALAPYAPELFGLKAFFIIMMGMLFVLGYPWLILTVGSPLAFLFDPARGAVMLGVMIMSIVMLYRG